MEARNEAVRVPEDLAIVGFDDQPLAKLLSPELTTIRQPVSELGHKAMDILIRRITGKNNENTVYTLPHELIIRGST
jgi:LacI family transcriptional regulator